MLERNAAGARIVELLATLVELLATLVELHPREAVQTLTSAVLQATGEKLLDDATVLVLGLVRRAGPNPRRHCGRHRRPRLTIVPPCCRTGSDLALLETPLRTTVARPAPQPGNSAMAIRPTGCTNSSSSTLPSVRPP